MSAETEKLKTALAELVSAYDFLEESSKPPLFDFDDIPRSNRRYSQARQLLDDALAVARELIGEGK